MQPFVRFITNLESFIGNKEYREVIEAYRAEKGLPEGFTFTPEIREELTKAFVEHLSK